MRALVLSGGGSKGAYQTGALKYLLGDLEHKYEILCGVSVGAINCSFISQFVLGQEKQCADELCALWAQLSSKSIYKRWFPFGVWHSLWRSSFFDSSPLYKLIYSKISLEKIRASGKQISVGAVSLSSGKYTIFDQSHNNFIDAVIASASFPGMLTPVKIGDQLWIDGGIKEISPIRTAIELGATDIDIIITSPRTRIRKFIEDPNTVDVLKRSIDLSTDKIMSNDIEKVVMYNKLAQAGVSDKKFVKLNIIRPEFNLIEDLLDFAPEKIKEMFEKGYNDARNNYLVNIPV
jgi:NTE family protein